MIDEEGISISYSDLDEVGVVTMSSTKSSIFTNSGTVSTSSSSYRFGQPVTITLNDPDLNLKNDTIEVYFVNNDPLSPNVDTVGKDGSILLEVLIKDIRFKRCTVEGVEHGGLGSTGFTMTETGPSTGVFKGVFKMPTKICDKSGTNLISPAGGSLDVRYHDARDKSGNPNVFSLLRDAQPSSAGPVHGLKPTLSKTDVLKPSLENTEEIILSGSVKNHKRGAPLEIVLTGPNGQVQVFGANLANSGSYKTLFTINDSSLVGIYTIELSHAGVELGMVSFSVSQASIPGWVKNNAKWWSSSAISDNEFFDSIEYLVEQGNILLPPEQGHATDKTIPGWMKNNADWWGRGLISDEDFVKSINIWSKEV